jgi:hypothetical protein
MLTIGIIFLLVALIIIYPKILIKGFLAILIIGKIFLGIFEYIHNLFKSK